MTTSTLHCTSAEAATVSGQYSGDRLQSLDAFRGLTILGMVLVNDPGDWTNLYAPLEHAKWFGWTLTDLVFPFFLFIVGTSLSYSLRKYTRGNKVDAVVYRKILRRTIVLFSLGLAAGFSHNVFDYLLGGANSLGLDGLRLPGILQRIALVYCAVSLIAIHLRLRQQILFALMLLLGYWALLAWLPNPQNYQRNLSQDENVVRIVDSAVLGESHMYSYNPTTKMLRERTDPEGLLSTLPAIVTAIFGYWTGLLIQRLGANSVTVGFLLWVGILCFLGGSTWGYWFPISKKLWTSSFVLLTSGLAAVLLAVCLLLFDVWQYRRLARPLVIVGVNAIFVYLACGFVSLTLEVIQIDNTSAQHWIFTHFFTTWIHDPKLASLAFALATVFSWWIILWAMSRRGWSVRI